MRVLVIGAGLSGLTSAWFLASRGHDVTVIDRAAGPGLETSFANGGLLTPSMADPWNSPGCWRTLLTSIGRENSALLLRLRVLPGLIGWGARFLWNSAPSRYARNTSINLRLALSSLEAMETIRDKTHIEYHRETGGSLRFFRDGTAFSHAKDAARELEAMGLSSNILSASDSVRLEPGLEAISDSLVGAIHYPLDEVGDAYRFCVGLADAAATRGVTFRWNCAATGFEVRAGRVSGLRVGSDVYEADAYLVACASHAPRLLGLAGVTIPVRPAKGYSLTFPSVAPPIAMPLVDDALHAVLVPLGNSLRVAGTAEFAGYDQRIVPSRVDKLIELVRSVLPTAKFDYTSAIPWCGLRAMSVDGVPLIGPTKVPNLHVNTGHGHLGWTMAAGAGMLAAAQIDGAPSPLDPVPYSPNRFGLRHG